MRSVRTKRDKFITEDCCEYEYSYGWCTVRHFCIVPNKRKTYKKYIENPATVVTYCSILENGSNPENLICNCKNYCKNLTGLDVETVISVMKKHNLKIGQMKPSDMTKIYNTINRHHEADKYYDFDIQYSSLRSFGRLDPFKRREYQKNAPQLYKLLLQYEFFEYSGQVEKGYYKHEFPEFNMIPYEFLNSDLIINYSKVSSYFI